MNGLEGRVGEQTRQRVLAAAEELGYLPSSSARSLRLRRTERVCLVIGALGVPAVDQLVRDLTDAADALGYGVMTILVDSQARAQKAVDLLRQRIADGAIIGVPVQYLSESLLRPLTQSGLPMVVMSNVLEPDGFDVVRTSERSACDEALEHLFAIGRRRIAFLAHGYELEVTQPTERLGAYLDALDRHGVDPAQRLVVPCADNRVAAYYAVGELLTRADRPDALFASSDRAAISAIWASRDAGCSVPGDVAIVGVGNVDEGVITKPALTTIGPPTQHYQEVAEALFSRLLEGGPDQGRVITTPWSFIRRGSA